LLEHAIGLKGDAAMNELTWRLQPGMGTVGCNRYWFAGKTVNLKASEESSGAYRINVSSDAPLKLKLQYGNRETMVEINGPVEFRIS
jgi:hypothetical protein